MNFARSMVSLAAVLALCGCRGGICLNTNSTVTTKFPTKGPLMSMAVEHAASPLKIAMVDVDGILLDTEFSGPYSEGENPVAIFREKLNAVAADPCVRGVVIRINSHGGGVTASDVMRHDLATFKARTNLPVVASLVDVGAGGAYFVATAADYILAHPTTVTGGQGVILNTYNLKQALDQFNIFPMPVKAGAMVDMGTPIVAQGAEGPLEAEFTEALRLLQQMANEFHDRFRQMVLAARPQLQLAADEVFTGRVYTAQNALQIGLVDEIGYLDDAVALAREMAGITDAHVVVFHRSTDRANSIHDITPNIPIQTGMLPISVPGFERAKLPTFLYMWQPEPTMERLAGK